MSEHAAAVGATAAAMQGVEQQVLHHLGEDDLSGIHTLRHEPGGRRGTDDSSHWPLDSFILWNPIYVTESM